MICSHFNRFGLRQSSTYLPKVIASKSEVDKNFVKHKKTWQTFYSADRDFINIAKRSLSLRYYGSKGTKLIGTYALVKSCLFMATDLPLFMIHMREIESFLLMGAAVGLFHLYLYTGKNPIIKIQINERLDKLRVVRFISAETTKEIEVSRSSVVPVEFDQIQAMQPLIIREESAPELLLGHFPVTKEVAIGNTIAFELVFGPSCYNTYQFFQRGERIGLESLYERRNKLLINKFTKEQALLKVQGGSSGYITKIDRMNKMEDIQRSLRYRRRSLGQQLLKISQPVELKW